MNSKKYLITSIAAGLTGFSFASVASAQTSVYLFDFNTVQSGVYPDASTWNIYAEPSDISGSVSDSTGSTGAGVSLGFTGTFIDSSGTGLYNAGSAPSWTGATAPAGDFFWTGIDGHAGGSNLSFTLTFSGLTQGSIVDLDVFGSRSSGNEVIGFYEYSTDNGATWDGLTVLDNVGDPATAAGWDTNNTQSQAFNIDDDGYIAGRYMTIGGVTVGSDESLMLRVTNDASSSYVGVNSMRLTTQVPEPSTYAMLFALAVGGMVLMRRRR